MLNHAFKFTIALTIIALLGCSNQSFVDEGIDQGLVKSEGPARESIAEKQYDIGVGDTLTINVWRNEELTMTMPVRPDGKISIPLLRDVQAAGLTSTELGENLQSRLLEFIRNPQVTVIVSAANSADYQNNVRIVGAVEKPVSVRFSDGMTVLDLVLEAGGLVRSAKGNGARLFRKTNDGFEPYAILVDDMLNEADLKTNYELAPSDFIVVP